MQYAIGTVEFFEALGFNTESWRKSIDGTHTLVHWDMVKEPLKFQAEYEVYRHDDAEFKELMQSDEWTEEIEE